jgi:hypothetical protein
MTTHGYIEYLWVKTMPIGSALPPWARQLAERADMAGPSPSPFSARHIRSPS